jgi:limonene-1,2-epoxide hydrolase
MAIVRDFETAFNRQDVDALVALFAPTASYTDTFYGTHRGHADLRAMFQKMFREGCQYAWTFDPVVESPACAMAEWSFSYVVTDAVPRSAGRRIRFKGMSLFELSGGKIAAYREHFDEGQALLQLGFAPESLAKVLRRKLEAR